MSRCPPIAKKVWGAVILSLSAFHLTQIENLQRKQETFLVPIIIIL